MTQEPEIVVANEFADVTVSRVATRNGTRLRIRSPRRGTHVDLDATALDAMTWQAHTVFSRMLQDPSTSEESAAGTGL